MYLSDFENIHPFFWIYLPPKFEVVQNRIKFCMFLAPKIFWREPLEIIDPYYIIEHTLSHRAKFHGDWPTELGDLVVRKRDS